MPGTRFSRTKRPNLRAPLTAIGCFCLAALAGSFHAVAQTGAAGTSASAMTLRATATLQGAVSDPKGEMVPKAAVTVRNTATGSTKSTTTDAEGRFSIAGLPAGTYTVSVEAHGFATAVKQAVALGADGAEIEVTLQMGQATQAVTVEADATHSIAAALAPMDALLSETSARTEITATMIHNFMSPVADYGEAVEMAPGTFTTNSNGVGLGQSSTTTSTLTASRSTTRTRRRTTHGRFSPHSSWAASTSTARPAPHRPSGPPRSAARFTCFPKTSLQCRMCVRPFRAAHSIPIYTTLNTTPARSARRIAST
jgi:hypothetical protein